MITCPNCGQKNFNLASICEKCRTVLNSGQTEQNRSGSPAAESHVETAEPLQQPATERVLQHADSDQPIESESFPPWEDKEVKYSVKLVAMVGATLLVLFTLVNVSGLLGTMSTLFSLRGEEGPGVALILLATELAILGLGIFGLIKVWSYLSAPTQVKLKFGLISPTALGKRFYVKFRPQRLARSFNGDGEIEFRDDRLEMYGTLMPSVAFQLGVILAVTILPIVIIGCGLGLIPALILAYYLGRKKMSRSLPYRNIDNLSVKGRTVSLSCSGEAPNKFKLRVASPDGERLYRELSAHSPGTVAKWDDRLRQIFSLSEANINQ